MEMDRVLTPAEIREARRRRLTAMGMQALEGNPLTSEEVSMFEMFEREGWTEERRRAFILDRLGMPSQTNGPARPRPTDRG